METSASEPRPIQTRLGLWDTASIVVGIIIGVGIFRTPADVFSYTSGPWAALALWGFAGLLSLVGAFCFAELGSAYPRSGGEYVYLTKAYGPLTGFLFAWAQLAVIRTGGSIAALAYVFAEFAGKLWQLNSTVDKLILAALAVALLTAVNILGVHLGKRTQNMLTVLKVVGLVVILLAALLWAAPTPWLVTEGQLVSASDDTIVLRSSPEASPTAYKVAPTARISVDGSDRNSATRAPWRLAELHSGLTVKLLAHPSAPETGAVRVRARQGNGLANLALALILVLWTYAGWHEAAYVAAEVENRRRNLPWALFLGTGAVILLYLLVNAAYIIGLGYESAAGSSTVAADVLKLLPWEHGEQAMTILIMISALGAINGMIFTSSRIYSELGADHRLFGSLARWSRRWGTPVRSLVVQAVITLAMLAVVGFWFEGKDGFDTLVNCTAPVFCLFFFLTGTSLIILRYKEPMVERPFTAPLYPLTPLIFCAFWAFMFYGSVRYAPGEACVGLGVLLAGLPLYGLSSGWRPGRKPDPDERLTTFDRSETGIQKPVGTAISH